MCGSADSHALQRESSYVSHIGTDESSEGTSAPWSPASRGTSAMATPGPSLTSGSGPPRNKHPRTWALSSFVGAMHSKSGRNSWVVVAARSRLSSRLRCSKKPGGDRRNRWPSARPGSPPWPLPNPRADIHLCQGPKWHQRRGAAFAATRDEASIEPRSHACS